MKVIIFQNLNQNIFKISFSVLQSLIPIGHVIQNIVVSKFEMNLSFYSIKFYYNLIKKFNFCLNCSVKDKINLNL